ncbi:Clp protease ClpP [Cellulosilyticum sp. ST5]|uniref:head maturation protease, ClpP-related n=1 Tax=Cellulosilyticum sp. ST5 TaxID=3055805 RepID=UPI003977B120
MPRIINVKGFIIPQEYEWAYAWMGYPYTTAAMVTKALQQANGEDVEVHINSYGGSTYVGSEIYTAIKDYKGKVLNKIVGLAASAASIVAMAAECLISPTGEMMIHCASTGNEGNYRSMDDTSQMLQVTDRTLVNAYVLKTGKSAEEIKSLMDAETWLTPQQALELKLVDKIMFVEDGQLDSTVQLQPVAALHEGFIVPNTDIVNELIKCGNVDAFKEKFMKGFNGQYVPVATLDIDENEKGVQKMTVNEFKEKHPELFNQITNEAKEQGANEERSRIQAIESIAASIPRNLIEDAKYNNPIDAKELAFVAAQDAAKKGQQFLDNLKSDSTSSNVEKVDAEAELSKEESEAEEANALAAAMNKDSRRVR